MPKTNIVVELTGHDGNAFSILAKVRKSLMENGYNDLIDEFMTKAMSGDYNHLLRTCMEYVEVE